MKFKITYMYLASITSGIIYWIIVSKTSGKTEAWDSPIYFTSGLLSFMVLNFALAYIEPQKSWRWGLTSTLSQFIPMFILSNFDLGPFGPLGLIFLIIFSIPSLLANLAGTYFKQKANSKPS